MKLLNRFPRWLRFLGLAVFVTLCVGVNAIAFTEIHHSLNRRSSTPAALSKTTALKISPVKPAAPLISTVKPIVSTAIASQPTPPPNRASKYGHPPYTAQTLADMVQVASYPEGKSQRSETLQPEAAKALMDMVAAARADGVWLVPASGFRTLAQQRTLFNAQVAKTGSPEDAAKTSAPPGYSEHHTGYAIDLTDGSLSQNQDITPAFAVSPAYRWLTKNAVTYGFELSFPENNPQGVSFEPWHWRYVGSANAKVTFGKNAPANRTSGSTEKVIE